jgi:hypothetical protein
MSALLKSIEEQARALSAEDRARLAESMLESLHTSIAEIEALWAEEIEERVSAFDRGEIPSYSAEQVGPPEKGKPTAAQLVSAIETR